MAAVELLVQHSCWSKLLQVAGRLETGERQGDRAALQIAAAAFRSAGDTDTVRELLNRLGDHHVGATFYRWRSSLQLYYFVRL